MPHIRKRIALATSVAALLAAAACGRSSKAPDDALLQDLQQASGTGVELAPQGNRAQQVVSAIEMTPSAKPAPERRIVRRAAQPKAPTYAAAPAPAREEPAPAVEPTKEPEPAPSVQPTPEPTPAPATQSRRPDAPMPLPLPAPSRRSGRHGGYSTEAEVIRNAPFPINPVERVNGSR